MKHEWRKKEKQFYLPKSKPEIVELPKFNFICIKGEGNPNDELFSKHIEALYQASYAIKMSHKLNLAPEGYFDYTVYPLEGVWDINEEAKKNSNAKLDKDSLVYKIMIRQPEFVTQSFAKEMIDLAYKKKKNEYLKELKFETIEEGKCIQMMHLGSYDNEPKTFKLMQEFADSENLNRLCMKHREIYISDARKVEPEKLKTVLRFMVE
jgi:hypothetical protein